VHFSWELYIYYNKQLSLGDEIILYNTGLIMVSSLTSPARIQIDNQMETTRVLERFVGAHAGNTARTTVIGRFYRLRCCGGFRQYGPASGCLPEQVKTHPADRQGGSDVQMDLPLCLRMR
jgi:hypothetical protein